MFHTAGWFVALANVANTDTPPITDDILQIQNAHLFMPENLKLVCAYASAVTLTRARLRSGVISQFNPYYIRPIGGVLLPANNPNVDWLSDGPLQLYGGDEVILELTDSAVGPNNAYALAWFMQRWEQPPVGDKYKIRFTSTSTAGVSVWTTIVSAFETNVPIGQYAVVGLEVQSTNIIAARLIFQNQAYRPGVIGISALTNRQFWPFDQSRFGVFGRFTSLSLPIVQVLCNAADAAFEGYLHCIRIGGPGQQFAQGNLNPGLLRAPGVGDIVQPGYGMGM